MKKRLVFSSLLIFAFSNSKSADIYVKMATSNLSKKQNKVKKNVHFFMFTFYVNFGCPSVLKCSLFGKIALLMHMRSEVEWQLPSFLKFKYELVQ